MLIMKMVVHRDGDDCLGGGTDKLLTLMMKVSAILILVDSGVTLTPS